MSISSEDIDLLALQLVGARLHPEGSHACPSHFYGDPSNAVRLSNIRKGKCDNCLNQVVSAEGQICLKEQVISTEMMHCEFYKGAKK